MSQVGKHPKGENRILFIFPEGNITNNPHFSSLIRLLHEHGFESDVVTPKRTEFSSGSLFPGCNVIMLDVEPSSVDHDGLITRSVRNDAEIIQRLQAFASQHAPYRWVIGIDRGIIEAYLLAKLMNIPYGLLSYEIFFADESGSEFKHAEIAACKELSFAICQDRLRTSFLCRENQIPVSKAILMPVAGADVQRGTRHYEIHEKLGLSPSTKLLLYMGELAGEWAGVKRFLSGVQTLPPDWRILLHHRFGNERAAHILPSMGLAGDPRVLFSPFAPLNFSEMHRLLHGVDLGAALYYGTFDHPSVGKNIHHIGLASGKFSTYLQYGVPVLTNTNGELSNLVQEYRSGIVIDNFNELGTRLRAYDESLRAGSREQAFRLFEERLDLRSRIEPLLKVLSSQGL